MCIYNPVEEKLIIGPFNFKSYDYIPYCLTLPNKVLLQVIKIIILDFQKLKLNVFLFF
jgi:hypothetical protein